MEYTDDSKKYFFLHLFGLSINILRWKDLIDSGSVIAVHFKDWSPGPAYHVDPRMTRTGMDGTPEYSMLARQKDLSKIYILRGIFYLSFKRHKVWVVSVMY